MSLNGHAQKIIKDVKTSDLRTNGDGSVVWRPGIKSIGFIILLLGFGAKGVLFYAQTADTTKTVNQLVVDIDSLKIEAYASENANKKLLREILEAVKPGRADAIYDRIEKEQKEETAKLKKVMKIKNGNNK